MGFFDGLMRGMGINTSNREIVEMYHDAYEDSTDYRKKTLENTPSNHGWYTCPRCGKKFRKNDMQADHIVPQSKGGGHSRYNLQLLCEHCNKSKRDDMSDTQKDLLRREKELKKQDKEDVEFLNQISRRKK